MMKNKLHNAPDTEHSPEMSESWNALLERIGLLAHRRSKSLLAGDSEDDDAFDRGARSLRTLMSAAEVAQRMKREEAKDKDPDDASATAGITEAAIEAAYRKVSDTVDRLERDESQRGSADAADQDGNLADGGGGAGGDALGGECA